MPTTPPSGSGGSLTIQVGNHINSQTLLPPISMTPVSYTVSGSGPGGASFSQTTTGAAVTVNSLAFGSWSITVNALNADGTLIGSGQAAATVHTGQTTTVAISVVPLTGNGSLNLTVSWTASQVETPSIVASLTPPTGPTTPLSFSVSGSQATYSSTTIPAGYQTLTVQLMDNGIAVMGAVEVVRIVAGQTTSGTYAFTNVNQPGGSVQVNITPALADPIPVSISGVPATIGAGTSVTATASVSDGTSGVVYVWYLNGVSVGTGASFTFGSALAAGYYRLDVTAYTATRAGSATAAFQVTGSLGGIISTVAGNGTRSYSGDGGPANAASLNQPYGIASDSSGNFFIADTYNNRIRKVDSSGLITTVAGTGTSGYSGDGGPAVAADLWLPYGIAVDTAGNLFIADLANHRIRRVDAMTGIITTVAGGGDNPGDGGLATQTRLDGAGPGVAIDSQGNLYIAELGYNKIRKVDANGIISTVAGNGFGGGTGSGGYSGDGGPATSAELNLPSGIAVDNSGCLFIVDRGNHRVRKVDQGGTITTVAGNGYRDSNGTGAFAGDGGPAVSAELNNPWGIALDALGSFYIADESNERVRKVSAGGIISTIAGTGFPLFSGDGGPATSAGLYLPMALAFDRGGNLLIVTGGDMRVRKVTR